MKGQAELHRPASFEADGRSQKNSQPVGNQHPEPAQRYMTPTLCPVNIHAGEDLLGNQHQDPNQRYTTPTLCPVNIQTGEQCLGNQHQDPNQDPEHTPLCPGSNVHAEEPVGDRRDDIQGYAPTLSPVSVQTEEHIGNSLDPNPKGCMHSLWPGNTQAEASISSRQLDSTQGYAPLTLLSHLNVHAEESVGDLPESSTQAPVPNLCPAVGVDAGEPAGFNLADPAAHGHARTLCPVRIYIEGCSDDETDNSSSNIIGEDRAIEGPSMRDDHVTTYSCPANLRGTGSLPKFLHISENSDLSTLKATAVRLRLRTRTPSLLAWKAKWLDRSCEPPEFPVPAEAEGCMEKLTDERKSRINRALEWLRTELREMQSVDQHLARQLLSLRGELHQLRLRQSCQQHRDLLDDFQSHMEEKDDLPDVLDLDPMDLPGASLNHTPLKNLGVTRLNICARRFSTC